MRVRQPPQQQSATGTCSKAHQAESTGRCDSAAGCGVEAANLESPLPLPRGRLRLGVLLRVCLETAIRSSNERPEEELTARWSRLVPPSAAPCRHDPRQYESSPSRQLERHAAVNAGSKLVASRRALWDLIPSREHPSRGSWTVKSGGPLPSWAPPSEVGLTSIALALRVGLP
jgi:hypothetical protein